MNKYRFKVYVKRSQGIFLRSVIGLCLLLPAISISGADHQSQMKTVDPNVEKLVKRLAALGESISTLEYREAVSIEDQWIGKPLKIHSWISRVIYSRARKRSRHEVLSTTGLDEKRKQNSKSSNLRRPSDEMRDQTYPDPKWLFDLPLMMRNTDVEIHHEGSLTRAIMFLPGEHRIKRFMEVTFGANGLPISMKTYGIKGAVQVECAVTWLDSQPVPYLSGYTLIAHSRQNILKSIHAYDEVRINAPVSATVFDASR